MLPFGLPGTSLALLVVTVTWRRPGASCSRIILILRLPGGYLQYSTTTQLLAGQ